MGLLCILASSIKIAFSEASLRSLALSFSSGAASWVLSGTIFNLGIMTWRASITIFVAVYLSLKSSLSSALYLIISFLDCLRFFNKPLPVLISPSSTLFLFLLSVTALVASPIFLVAVVIRPLNSFFFFLQSSSLATFSLSCSL